MIALRYLMIQDWDLDQDFKPDTLRLLYATPRRWLADGRKLEIKDAPTAFGRVSLEAESKLGEGRVDVRFVPPPREVETISLRLPLPTGWRVRGAEIAGKSVKLNEDGSVDLTGTKATVDVRFNVEPAR